ncbi:MAG TPA: DNA/RNA non-specific endonuclease, partial [Lacunisphaera sp.]|nr:DNA/RNA non-specific endonuclease [Lacunisphaera sp.]
MGRKSSKVPRALRRTKAFVVANIVLWGAVGGWYLFQPAARQKEIGALIGNAVDGRKQITAFEVAWDLWQLYYSKDYVAAVAPGDTTHIYGGVPQPGSGRAPLRVLANTGYMAGYSDELGNPLWAAYRVRDAEPNEAPPRPEGFAMDMRTVARIDPGLYERSGYDRGHLAPNFVIATRYGPQAQRETFLMSNIIPQKHALNAGRWKDLEQRIARNYPARFGEVWVLAGPVFAERPTKIHRRIAVPEACYMIIVDENEGRVRTAAFLFPQDTPADALLADYLVSIDEIERRTGLDFLAELPDDAEAALESRRIER